MPCHTLRTHNYVVIVLKLFASINAFYYTLDMSVCTPSLRSKNNFDEIKQKADSVCTHFNNCYIIGRVWVCLCVFSLFYSWIFDARNTCDFAFHAMSLAREVILFKSMLLLSLGAFITINNYRVWFASGTECVTVFFFGCCFVFGAQSNKLMNSDTLNVRRAHLFWSFQLASAI